MHLFHCIDPTPYNMGAPDAVQTAREAAWRDMQRLDSDLRSSGLAKNIEVKLHVEAAELLTILREIVKDLDLGLIVVGTHGRTGWKKLALGSVAGIIVDHASCPVLAVGPYTDRSRLEQFGPESILLTTMLPRIPSWRNRMPYRSRGSTALGLPSPMCSKTHAGRVLARVSQFEWRDSELRDDHSGRNITSLPQLPPEIGTQSDLILQCGGSRCCRFDRADRARDPPVYQSLSLHELLSSGLRRPLSSTNRAG